MQRVTYILNRGQYDQPIKEGENAVINPGVPSILPKLSADAPANRLGFAEWSALNEVVYRVGERASASNFVVSELHYRPSQATKK